MSATLTAPHTPRRVRSRLVIRAENRYSGERRYVQIDALRLSVYGGPLGPGWAWRMIGAHEVREVVSA